jgi:hypothetical protein
MTCVCGMAMKFLGHCKYVCEACGYFQSCSEGT